MSQNLNVTSYVDANNNLAFKDANTGQIAFTLKAGGIIEVPSGATLRCLSGSTFSAPGSSSSYVATETGANNAIAAAYLDSSNNPIALAAGLQITLQLAHTLQAGANTFNLNATGAKSILSCRNTANNIATAYAPTGVIELFYNGTAWLDLSQ